MAGFIAILACIQQLVIYTLWQYKNKSSYCEQKPKIENGPS